MRIISKILAFLPVFSLFVKPAFGEGASEIRIGLMAGLSGPSANVGQDCMRGYELARKVLAHDDRVGNYQLRFVYADHQADPKTGLTEFNRLLDIDKVHAVATHRSPVALAINPVSRRRGLPILLVTGHSEIRKNNPHAFEFWPLVSDEGRALARKLVEIDDLRMAILTTEDDWTLGLRDEFVAAFKQLNGVVVFDEEVPKGDTDFSSYAARIKKSKPDAIFVNLRPGQVGTAVKYLRRLGVLEQLAGNFYMRKSEEIDIAGVSAIEGALLVEPDFAQKHFLREAKKNLGDYNVTGVTYTCYSTLAFLIQTLRNNPKITDSKKLSEALAKSTKLELPDESVDMMERAARYNLAYRTIENGKVVSLAVKQRTQ